MLGNFFSNFITKCFANLETRNQDKSLMAKTLILLSYLLEANTAISLKCHYNGLKVLAI